MMRMRVASSVSPVRGIVGTPAHASCCPALLVSSWSCSSSAGWSVATHASLFGAEEELAARNVEDLAVSEVEMGVIDGARDAAHSQALAAEQSAMTDEDRLVARRNFKFHCVMASASMYMAMVLTDWGSDAAASDITFQDGELTGRAYDLSVESLWLKFASQWLTMILYGWSVIAPVACKGRDFA